MTAIQYPAEVGHALLSADRVTKRFPGEREPVVALEPATFSVREGEFVALVGPSGCGKTTLLRMCAGLLGTSGGTITYRDTGRPISPGTYGIVFQQPALLEWRTVEKNLLLPAQILGLDLDAARRRIAELLERVHLTEAADRLPAQLSGGMQQRAAIARALVHDPDVLFMDEPFGALDAFTREALNDDLAQLHLEMGKTVLFVTHDIDEAVYLSDRILVMASRPGRLVDIRDIGLPRPRDRESAPFRAEVGAIRRILAGETHD